MWSWSLPFIFESDATNWIVVGLILSLLELIAPGVYLIWFGFAAFVMSVVVYFTPLALTTQLIWFAVFSAIFALIGLYVYGYIFKKTKTPTEYSHLNDSAAQYVGQTVTLAEDVVDNRTKVKIGDGYWIAACEKPLKRGNNAKVIGVKDGVILVIE
ncbi:MAG: NfeD family protein [Alphaproteobacteria bacterium]|nr:NfeD family protein [Alphaproteobacteria bacterium]